MLRVLLTIVFICLLVYVIITKVQGSLKDREPLIGRQASHLDCANPSFKSHLAINLNRFELIEPYSVNPDLAPEIRTLTLNKNPIIYNGKRFDGFRFAAKNERGQSFVWAFVAPGTVSTWYAFSANHLLDSGFKTYWPCRRAGFRRISDAPPRNVEKVIVQQLPADVIRYADDYIICFGFENDQPREISFVCKYASSEDNARAMAAALAIETPRLMEE